MRFIISLLLLSVLGFAAPSSAEAAKQRKMSVRLDGLGMKVSARNLNRLKHAVRRVPGVRHARVDLRTGHLYVTHRRSMNTKRLFRATSRVGFRPLMPSLVATNRIHRKKKS